MLRYMATSGRFVVSPDGMNATTASTMADLKTLVVQIVAKRPRQCHRHFRGFVLNEGSKSQLSRSQFL